MLKRFFAVIIAIALIFTFIPPVCAAGLTYAMAEHAIRALLDKDHGCPSLQIVGILEVQQNVARADFNIELPVPTFDNRGLVIWKGPGSAAFVHYNDGTWRLNEMRAGHYTWKNLDVIAK